MLQQIPQYFSTISCPLIMDEITEPPITDSELADNLPEILDVLAQQGNFLGMSTDVQLYLITQEQIDS